MKKEKIYIILITLLIFSVVGLVIYINLTYKTREEKWDEYVSNLSTITKDYSDDSFLMSIIYKNDVSDEGVTLEGKVLRGSVKTQDEISLVASDKTYKVKVEKILNDSNEEISQAEEEDRINIVISGIDDKVISPGQVLAQADTIKSHKEFIAEIYILSEEEGGIDKKFKEGDYLSFYIRTSPFTGKVEKIKEFSKVKPGSAATIKVKLNSNAPIEVGTTFVIRSDSKTMGAGEITSVIK